MHNLARENVSEWRHFHGNMSLESKDREIRRQSAHRHFLLCEKLHTEKGASVKKSHGDSSRGLHQWKIRRQTRCHMLNVTDSQVLVSQKVCRNTSFTVNKYHNPFASAKRMYSDMVSYVESCTQI